MADTAESEEGREQRYLGSQLQIDCRFLKPLVEYCVGANSYRRRQDVQRRSQSDIIMDFVVLHPDKALTFMSRAILCGVIMNICVYMTEEFVCRYAYPRKISLSPSIWWWLLVNKALQALQVPLRVFLLYLLRRLNGRSFQEITYCMSVLTTCRMWYWSKCLTVANYVWYGVGFIFTSKPQPYNEEWLSTMAAYVFCIIGFRVIFTFMLIYYAFPPSSRRSGEKPPSRTDFATIPIVLYKDVEDIKSTMCGICLEEFGKHDRLRLLQCKHGFHVSCIDAWLFRRTTCPLCMSRAS